LVPDTPECGFDVDVEVAEEELGCERRVKSVVRRDVCVVRFVSRDERGGRDSSDDVVILISLRMALV